MGASRGLRGAVRSQFGSNLFGIFFGSEPAALFEFRYRAAFMASFKSIFDDPLCACVFCGRDTFQLYNPVCSTCQFMGPRMEAISKAEGEYSYFVLIKSNPKVFGEFLVFCKWLEQRA